MGRSPETIYDELLVLRCQEKDHAAFDELVARWQRRLWRHALQLTGKEDAAWHALQLTGKDDAAWDVLQDAWMAIVRGIGKLNDPASFPNWAYRIVTHKSVDWTRRQQRQRQLVKDVSRVAEKSARETGEKHVNHESDELRAALRRLSGDRRAILSMYYVERMSMADIAHAFDIPAGTVKSRLFHAREQLKGVLERMKT